LTYTLMSRPDIYVKKLSYSHTPSSPPSLRNISIYLPPGSRTIICGANGGQCDTCLCEQIAIVSLSAGKSTLLQILAGKRLVTAEGADVRIKGKDVFRESPPGVTFLGTEWFVSFDPILDRGSAKFNPGLGQ
jgi:CCR4-NOT complex subunit CAF16